MKLILHIGQPKTGTTSIQNILRINKKKLQDFGYLYETNALNHQPIMAKIQQASNPDLELKNFVTKLKEKAIEQQCNVIILSSEAFLTMDKYFIRNLINEFNIMTEAIVYLKRQDLFLESSWKQWHFKNLHYKDFNDFVKKFELYDYFTILDEWRNLLGKNNIKVFPFEKRIFPNGLLKHFLQQLKLSEEQISQMNFDIPKTMFGTNQGLSTKGLKFAFLVRELSNGPLDYKIENFIHKYLGDVFHKDHFENYGLFELEDRKKYIGKWEECNSKVSKDFFDSNTLFTDTIDIPKSNEEITIDDIAKVVMSLGIKMDDKLV